jgi:hypothetical protein
VDDSSHHTHLTTRGINVVLLAQHFSMSMWARNEITFSKKPIWKKYHCLFKNSFILEVATKKLWLHLSEIFPNKLLPPCFLKCQTSHWYCLSIYAIIYEIWFYNCASKLIFLRIFLWHEITLYFIFSISHFWIWTTLNHGCNVKMVGIFLKMDTKVLKLTCKRKSIGALPLMYVRNK